MRSGPRRVLIVEDNPLDRRLIAALLKTLRETDVETHEAADARSAWNHLRDHQYDVVIADLHLGPTGTGVDVLANAKALQPACRRILLTGENEPAVLNAVDKSGTAERIVLKAGSIHNIVEEIGALLRT